MGRRRGGRDRQSAGSARPDTPNQQPVDDDFLDAFLGVGAELNAAPVDPVGLPLRDIWPDPAQPRRAMPAELRDAWLRGVPIHDVLERWEVAAHAAAIDARQPLRWKHIIDQEDDPTPLNENETGREADLPPVAVAWLTLVRLAGSIHQVGLEQPVTVYPVDQGYCLIVGERRLLAFHLLHKLGYEGYSHIPAIKRQEAGVWRQAFENGARQDLNAVSKARQLALLLMALNPGAARPFTAQGQPDQRWYAQAADLRVPYGRAEAVATVLGLKNPRQLRRYRALLTLPGEVWELADAHNWPEGRLRGMIKAADGDSDQLVRIARIDAGLETFQQSRPDPAQKAVEQVVHKLEVIRQIKPSKQWSRQQREAVRQAIQDARRQLDELEQKLK